MLQKSEIYCNSHTTFEIDPQLSEICFKEKSSEFQILIDDYLNLDIDKFSVKYQKMLLANFDREDFNDLEEYLSEMYLFIIFGNRINKIYSIDWSGEEYSGEIKRSITTILKTLNSPTFKWNNKRFFERLNLGNLRRGDFLGLLFKEFDKKLNDLGFQLLFIELFDDEYHYTILPKNKMDRALKISNAEFKTYDSKLYEISIIEKPENTSKLMLYLKKKFAIPINRIKEFTESLPISIDSGNLLKIKSTEKELKELGCIYQITEK